MAEGNGSSFIRYGYGWVTFGFFLVSIIGHWLFGWFAYVGEQAAHQQPLQVSEYAIQMARDTFENWQSEFLQLLWQVGGLAALLWVGSPASRENDDRVEAKIDALLKAVAPDKAEALIAEIDDAYAGRQTDALHAHRGGKKI